MNNMDITRIPTKEMIDDRSASRIDLHVCLVLLAHDHTHYSDGKSIQDRHDVNADIIKKIDAELARRTKG